MEEIKKMKRLNWEKYSWREFEKICFEYAENKYEAPAYKVFLTKSQKDGGRDIVIENTKTSEIAWGECKHHKKSVNLDQIGKNVILSITNNVQKLIFFSVSPITANTKCEIIKATRIHGFTVSFFDGDNLDKEIALNKHLLNKYFKESNRLYYERKDGVEVDVFVDEYKTAYNETIYSNKKYWKLKKGLKFYIHLFIKNWYDTPISIKNVKIEENAQIHIEPSKINSIYVDSGCDSEITICGMLFNTQIVINLPIISIKYDLNNKLCNLEVPLGEIDGTDIWRIPICGNTAHNFLSSVIPQLIVENKEGKSNIVYLNGCSGCGKTRLMEETTDKLSQAGIDTIYINAQIFKKSAFYRELLRQVLCIPTVDSTDIFNYETFKILLEKSNFKYNDLNKLFNFFCKDAKLTSMELTELLYSCILKVSINQNLCTQIDNIQELDTTIQESLVFLCEKLKLNRVPVILFFSHNTTVQATHKGNPLLAYLNYEMTNGTGTFLLPISLGELDDNSASSMVQQLLKLEPGSSKETNKIIKKTGKIPLDILLFCKLLSESNCFSKSGNFNRIVAPKEFRNKLDTLSSEMNSILKSRFDALKTANKKEKTEIQKICQLIVFFENRLPINVIETLKFSKNSIVILEKSLVVTENAYGEISFFHDNYFRYFLGKEDYSLFSKTDFKKISKFIKQMKPIYGNRIMVNYAKCLFYLGQIEEFLEISEKLLEELLCESMPIEVDSLARFYVKHINGEKYKNQRLKFMIESAYTQMELQSFESGVNAFREIEINLYNNYRQYDINLVCKFYHHYVNTYLHSGQYHNALKALDKFRKIDKLPPYYEIIIEDRYCIAYAALGDFYSANSHINLAIKKAKKIEDRFLISTVFSDKAFNYLKNTNQNSKTAKFFNKAVQYYSSLDDTTNYRAIEINIQESIIHLLKRNYNKAYNSIDTALTLSQKRSYIYLSLPAQNIKAFLFMKEKQFEDAFSLLQDCLFNSEVFGSDRKVIVANNSMGILYALKGDYHSAMQYFKTAFNILVRLCTDGGGISQVLPVAFNIVFCSHKNESSSKPPQLPNELIEQIPFDKRILYKKLLNKEIDAKHYINKFSLTISDYIYIY